MARRNSSAIVDSILDDLEAQREGVNENISMQDTSVYAMKEERSNVPDSWLDRFVDGAVFSALGIR